MNGLLLITPAKSIPAAELEFRSSRSSGPGGQNVNKLETRVELLFDISRSRSLSDEDKRLLQRTLASKIDRDGVLHVVAQESRSQWENKQRAIEKFVGIIRQGLKRRKKRVRSKPTAASRESRLRSKKKHGLKKKMRKERPGEHD